MSDLTYVPRNKFGIRERVKWNEWLVAFFDIFSYFILQLRSFTGLIFQLGVSGTLL